MEGDFNDRVRAECYVAVGGGNGEPTALISSNGLIESVLRNSTGNYTVTLRAPGLNPQAAAGRAIPKVSAVNSQGQWVTCTFNPGNPLQVFVFGWGVTGDPGAIAAADTSFTLSISVAQRLGGIITTPAPDHPN